MRYGDLIQFEPIESVIQLLDANRPDEGKKLVSTYVISDDMAERIAKLMIPQLAFDESVDHKGVLVVGNYGTGKSHLMSVLSLVAEDASFVPMIRHPKVAEAATAIAGKFKVHRIEISSQMSLRDIITQQLELFLEKHGISYSFPPADKVVNNKAAFEEMMAAFTDVHPNHGVLLVVDEFLEYLRSRKDHDLVLDLSFLREIGEVTKHLRFRFVAGVQEAIFDSSRFEHVADSLRRVKDRFTQVLLARQDVSFVVTERLLKKSADQQDKIRGYLTPFAKFYGSMNERMDEYVRLFPVHPDYLKTFERISFAEKRNALETLSLAMRSLVDKEVPSDHPGLITFDEYWKTVQGNSVFRSDPNIKEVLRVSEVLDSRVQQAFTRPAYKAMALRIINGLFVHRLTTGGDIHVPIGPTAEELRDTLCLYQPGIDEMGGDPAADLLSLVQTVLREVLKTVNGQFISKAPDTEQYYLDLKKDIDYDAQIEKRAEALSDDTLDRAYYSAIKQLMERTDETTYVTGHQIWQYQIEWQDRRVDRNGYLFFGAPNDRPTAQPERDFYIYFIQPFEPPRFRDESKADEVFFRLKGLDEEIKRHLSFYAAALDLASTASGGAKAIYISKAQDVLRAMSKWLQEKQMTAFEVTYQGKTKTLQEWSKGVSLRDKARLGQDERINFRDVVNVISGLALNPQFAEASPEYPSFSVLVTEANRKQLIGNALKALAGGTRTKDANAILDALEMLDGDRIEPGRSKYAQEVLVRLKSKGHGQVLNRSELLSGSTDVEYFAPLRFRLEPDLLVTVLGGLVYSGDIVLAITGDKIDSGKLTLLAERSLDELKQFKHLEAPKEINVAVLRSLFELLGLSPGLAQLATQGSEEPVKQLQESVSALVRRVLAASTDMQGRLTFWGQSLLREEEVRDWRARLDALKGFTESLAPYNTVGKLKNLRIGSDDINAQKKNLEVLAAVERLLGLVTELGGTAAYLSQAEMVLPGDHPWVKQAQTARTDILAKLSADRTAQHSNDYRQTLGQLKKDYVTAYITSHSKARLGVAEDKTKTALRKDSRLVAMRALAGISLMPTSQLTVFEEKLDNLKSCYQLSDSELVASPFCPHCSYKPANESLPFGVAANALTQLDDELDRLLAGWQQTLLDNLDDPIIQANLDLLKAAARTLIQSFMASKTLPDPVTPDFVSAVQEALSGLEKIAITSDDIKNALLHGGSPATPDDLRKRFETFLNERCKGKDATKLRFVVE
ncbi:MAG: ATP-binding protein [Gammaproteobacteria bacterium]|nr:ATP-binding protein [Gammaproteobacteria bacterium]MBU1409772.1 ATP-binding protein [Gammaproteobacteria bacterium]